MDNTKTALLDLVGAKVSQYEEALTEIEEAVGV